MSNSTLNQRLRKITPGGVNSPFRSFQAVGGEPPVMVRGQGARVQDADGRSYLDLCGAWGPLILGHSHPVVREAVEEAASSGVIFGAPTPWEADLAELVQQALPSMQMVRFVNSGAEAVASALRVARGNTRRSRILKFEGCYHGHVESLDSSGAEAVGLGGPLAMGASPGAAQETLVGHFNDIASLEEIFRKHGSELAAAILEPITGSMGVITVQDEFLDRLAHLCHDNGSLVIFDEVLSGFRVALGGAQQHLGFSPDLTCLGKALGGGLPIGAYGGRAQLMSQVAPLGPIYQAGTFCGNPVSMKAGTACLRALMQPGQFPEFIERANSFQKELQQRCPQLTVQGVGGLFSVHFGPKLHSHVDLDKVDQQAFAEFYHRALALGLYLPPSCLDAACLSLVHSPELLQEAISLIERAL